MKRKYILLLLRKGMKTKENDREGAGGIILCPFQIKNLNPKVQENWIPESKDGSNYANMFIQIYVGKGKLAFKPLHFCSIENRAHRSITLTNTLILKQIWVVFD